MSKKQTIELTKKQFLALMKAVYIGNWIANAQTIPSDKKKNEYDKIEDLIFSFAGKFGYKRFVDHEEKDGDSFYPTRWFEEETDVHKKIQEYEDDSFWDELIDRMARLTMSQRYSKKELEEFTQDEFLEEFFQIQHAIAKEFEKFGISRLKIVK
ncbi:hypothetical protein GF357_01595 [Candidatus Dojkabacteria bacterium]|nr:hypothetical protein [Candidatus Dojkabacteria bacterium]